MTSSPEPGASGELVERAVAYARAAWWRLTPADLTLPTPCSDWLVGDLVQHLTDSMAAFTEAGHGSVSPHIAAAGSLPSAAHNLLAAWSSPHRADVVRLGAVGVAVDVVGHAAALEIAVHGWDLATATGRGPAFPETLAADLLPAAHTLIDPVDRGPRFAAALAVAPGAGAAERLLAWCGRRRVRAS